MSFQVSLFIPLAFSLLVSMFVFYPVSLYFANRFILITVALYGFLKEGSESSPTFLFLVRLFSLLDLSHSYMNLKTSLSMSARNAI